MLIRSYNQDGLKITFFEMHGKDPKNFAYDLVTLEKTRICLQILR